MKFKQSQWYERAFFFLVLTLKFKNNFIFLCIDTNWAWARNIEIKLFEILFDYYKNPNKLFIDRYNFMKRDDTVLLRYYFKS